MPVKDVGPVVRRNSGGGWLRLGGVCGEVTDALFPILAELVVGVAKFHCVVFVNRRAKVQLSRLATLEQGPVASHAHSRCMMGTSSMPAASEQAATNSELLKIWLRKGATCWKRAFPNQHPSIHTGL